MIRCLAMLLCLCQAATAYGIQRLSIVSAQSDVGGPIEMEASCHLTPSPNTMQLKVGHVHRVDVSGAGALFKWQVRDAHVATVSVDERTSRTAYVKGEGVGETELIVTNQSGSEVVRLQVRGISSRYTVVAWIDGSRIDPAHLAPKANEVLQGLLSAGCGFAELGLWMIGLRGHVESADDVLYAKAFLVRATANKKPDRSLTETLFHDQKRYKLWNDFQFDSRGALLTRAEVGRTPIPCNDQLPGSWAGQAHPENNLADWNAARTMYNLINEARIGTEAQYVDHIIDPTGPGVPWIWSVIGFDKSGLPSLNTQIFPTYWIYRDGVRCGSRVQKDLARFFTKNLASELKRSDLDRYKATEWSDPCTED